VSVSLPLSHQVFPLGQQITPATRHPPPETLRCFLIDSAIGASTVRPPTDAMPSRPYLCPRWSVS